MRRRGSAVKTVLLIILLLIVSVFIFVLNYDFDTTLPDDQGQLDQQEQTGQIIEQTNGERVNQINAILNDKYMVLVNPDNGLSSDYAPQETTTIDGYTLEATAAVQLRKMLDDALEAGYTITIYSAYRNYAKQETNFNNKINQYINQGYDRETAEQLAANIVNPPGKSEHQTGLAVDICTAEMVYKYGSLPEQFSETEEYAWLYEHCAEYGFILRYPEDKEDITGITYEPWHYRYVGLDRAKEIMDAKISLEEYIEDLQAKKAALEQ